MTVAGVSPAAARIASVRSIASASVAFPLRRLKVSVAAKVTLTRSSPAAAKRSQPRSLRTRPESSTPSRRSHALDHLLRARHLRHAVGADEADGLDAPQPRRREPVDELRPCLRRQHVRLVLEAVPRPDVAEEDLHPAERTPRG